MPRTTVSYPDLAFFHAMDAPNARIQNSEYEPNSQESCIFLCHHTEEAAHDELTTWNVTNPFVEEEAHILDIRRPRHHRQRTTTISFVNNATGDASSASSAWEIFTALLMSSKRGITDMPDSTIHIPPERLPEIIQLLRNHLGQEAEEKHQAHVQRGRSPQHTTSFIRGNSYP